VGFTQASDDNRSGLDRVDQLPVREEKDYRYKFILIHVLVGRISDGYQVTVGYDN
jgi:hypothetical protein